MALAQFEGVTIVAPNPQNSVLNTFPKIVSPAQQAEIIPDASQNPRPYNAHLANADLRFVAGLGLLLCITHVPWPQSPL
jgi:hypothetical protein